MFFIAYFRHLTLLQKKIIFLTQSLNYNLSYIIFTNSVLIVTVRLYDLINVKRSQHMLLILG
jgi:hypothetical protein